VVRASRLAAKRSLVTGSSPGPRNNSVQVVHTHVPLFTKQYKLERRHSTRHTIAPCPRTYSFGWCLAEGYRNGDQRRPMGLVAREKL